MTPVKATGTRATSTADVFQSYFHDRHDPSASFAAGCTASALKRGQKNRTSSVLNPNIQFSNLNAETPNRELEYLLKLDIPNSTVKTLK